MCFSKGLMNQFQVRTSSLGLFLTGETTVDVSIIINNSDTKYTNCKLQIYQLFKINVGMQLTKIRVNAYFIYNIVRIKFTLYKKGGQPPPIPALPMVRIHARVSTSFRPPLGVFLFWIECIYIIKFLKLLIRKHTHIKSMEHRSPR